MAKQDDSLFLLEVLVDKIKFQKSPCFTEKDFRTCINIEVPGVEPLEVCDDHPGACVARSSGPLVKQFNIGKSCLFSLCQGSITTAMNKFPVQVIVSKSLPCGCLPTKIVMGEATIDMTKEFVQARNNYLKDPTSVSYQALKDSFRLIGPDKDAAGEITMFLRISCLGKSVITKFQGSGGSPGMAGVIGGSSGPNYVDRSCNPHKEYQSADDPCACGTASRSAMSGGKEGAGNQTKPCPGGGVCSSGGRDPYNSMPCMDADNPCYCTGAKPAAPQQMACRNTDPYCLHIPKGPSNQFEEIGTTLGGNELKIKVPASASIIKKISLTHCAMQKPYVKGKETGPCENPCGKNQISLALPSEDICCRGAQPANTQFTCTTEACTQASKHGQQQLARGDNLKPDPTNFNVFVLKVAKTAIQGDRKCKLELELVAPKGPEKKMPVARKNLNLQADSQCLCCVRRLKRATKKKYCCPVGNKVIFQMPSDTCGNNHRQRAHFNFTSAGVGDMARDEPGQLLPSTAEDYPGVVYDLPNQVIKLRVGRTIEMTGRKSKLEYQFITPVVNYEKIVPVRDTRTAQCMPSNACPNMKRRR